MLRCPVSVTSLDASDTARDWVASTGRLALAPVQDLPRRSFLAGGLAAGSLVLVACGSSDDGGDTASSGDGGTDQSGLSEELTFLTPAFPDGFRQASVLVTGAPQRLAFVVRDEIDTMRESAPATLDIVITSGDTTVFEGTLDRRDDGIITPYYSLETTFEFVGPHAARLPGHPDVTEVPFLVLAAGESPIPQAGEQLPVVPTPTFDDARGVADICTRAIDCPFHEIDLADAAANDKPTVLLIATPGFCQTDICGPVVDLLMDEAADRDDLNVIHAEVYVDPADFETGGFPDLAPIVTEIGLPFEPALFVVDADNTVVARLDTTFDRSELRDALSSV